MMRWVVAAAALLWAGAAAQAEEIYSPLGAATVRKGPAQAIDGDTLWLEGAPLRLQGLDGPELSQRCGEAACGRLARDWIEQWIAGREVECLGAARDQHSRFVAVCRVGRDNLNRELVAAGWAVAYTKYTDVYQVDEDAAREAGLGLWGLAGFQRPSDYKKARAALGPQTTPPSADCALKGVRGGDGALVWRAPGSPGYEILTVDEGKDERWFCSPEDARAAGWTAEATTAAGPQPSSASTSAGPGS